MCPAHIKNGTMGRSREGLNSLGAVSLAIGDGVRRAMLGETDLDESALTALVTIDANPGGSVSELAQILQVSHSGAVRMSKRLQGQGLIFQQTGRDPRTVELFSTREGREHLVPVLRSRRVFLEEVLDELDEGERQQLRALLTTIARRLAPTEVAAQRACRMCQTQACSVLDCPIGTARTRARPADDLPTRLPKGRGA